MSCAPNVFLRASAVLLAVGLGLAAPLTAQSELSTAELLPEGTLGIVGVDDLQAFTDGYLETAFGRFFSDPAFAELYAEIADGLAGVGADVEEFTGLGTAELLALHEGRVAVAMIELEPPEDDRLRSVGMVALIGLAEDAEEEVLDLADRLAERFLDHMRLNSPDTTAVQKFEEREGVDVSLIVVTENDKDFEFAYAVGERTLVVVASFGEAVEEAYIDGILAALQGDGSDRLADAPGYSVSPLGGPAAPGRMFAWVEVDPIVQAILEFQRQMDAAMREAFKVEGWEPPAEDTTLADNLPEGLFKPLVLTLTADESGQRQLFQAGWNEHPWFTPVASALPGGQSPSLASVMPPDIGTAFLADLDLAGTFDAVLGVLAEQEPGAVREVLQALSAAEEETGFHPRNDLLEALSGQFGVFAKEPEGGVNPNDPMAAIRSYCLVVGLDDPEVMREFLDGLIRSQGLHVAREREVFEGFEVYSVPVFPGVSVQYAIAANTMVVSAGVDRVHDVLRRFSNEALASLGSDERYLAARAEVSPEATVLVVTDAAESVQSLLDMPQLVLSMLRSTPAASEKLPWGSEEIGIDDLFERLDALMPDSALVGRYIDGFSVTMLSVEGGGLRGEAYTP